MCYAKFWLGIAIHSTTSRFHCKSLSLQDFVIGPDIQGGVILSLRADLVCKQGIHSQLLLCVSGKIKNWSWRSDS
jgi:hypothetical protein